jgi:hypothetical protein
MAEIGDLCREVFQELETTGLFNPEFTWAGETFQCIPNNSNKSGTLEDGGFGIDMDLVLYCRTDQFSTLPTRGQTLTRDSVSYRIEKVGNGVDSSYIRLGCVNVSRGA